MNDLLCPGLILVLLLGALRQNSCSGEESFGLYDNPKGLRSFPFDLLNQGFSNAKVHLYQHHSPHLSHNKRRRKRMRWSKQSKRPSFHKEKEKRTPGCRCGVKPRERTRNSRFRVVGGSDGKFKRPWYSYLLVTTKISNGKPKRFECGGILINYRYILTAAHCICKLDKKDRERDKFCLQDDPFIHVDSTSIKTIKALIGENHKSLVKKYGRDTDLYIIHEQWMLKYNQHYDIALVRLKNRIHKFTHRIHPICLPSSPKIEKISEGKDFEIDYSMKAIVAGFGHLGYATGNKVQCHTDHRLPRPFHTCKSKCFSKETPSFNEEVCQELAQKVGSSKYEKNFDGDKGGVKVWSNGSTIMTPCFSFKPGSRGWCKVFPNFRSDKLFKVFENSSWGFCGERFCESRSGKKYTTKKLQEIDLSLIPPLECEEALKAVATQSTDNKVFAENEFCAGRKHRMKVFNYERKEHSLNVSPEGSSDFTYIGGGDTCAGDSGSGMWQWIKDPHSDRFYGVVIGIVSRGYGCAFVNRPGIYISVPALQSWIHSYAKKGGCI